MIVNLTDKIINDFIAQENAVVIFSAPWCQPCKILSPVLAELSETNPLIHFGKINVDENPDACSNFSIRSVPTVLYIKNGKMLDSSVGNIPRHKIQEKLINLIA